MLLLLISAGAAASPPAPFVVPTELASGVSATAVPVEMDLYVEDAAALAAILQVTPAPPAGAGHIRYRAVQYPQIQATPDRTWLESTFVVDHDDPDVQQLYVVWSASADLEHPRTGIVEFVSARMHARHGRGFDVASTVARRREGDCTEYAVLTTALARRAGLPARVVSGVALLHGADGPTGMGHAWTEVLEGGRWVVADAALARAPAPVTYIPYGVMEDEGLGFEMSRIQTTSRWIRKIVVVGAEPRSPPMPGGTELEQP